MKMRGEWRAGFRVQDSYTQLAKKRWLIAAAAAAVLPSVTPSARGDLILWTGAANTSWDGASLNWNDLTSSTNGVAYTDGSQVQFNDSNGGAVATPASVVIQNVASAGVSPASVTFSDNGGTTGSYTFTAAAAATGGIEGAASVTLNSGYSGVVYLNEVNTYTGGTTINGGTLQVNSAVTSLGSGTVTLGGGTLQFNHSGALSNPVVVTAGTTASDINATSSANNPTINAIITSSAGATAANTTLNFTGAAVTTIGPASGTTNTLAGFTGKIELNGLSASLRFSATTAATSMEGSSSALFDLGSGTASMIFQNTIGVALLGGLEGGTTTTIGGNTHNSSVNYNQQNPFAIGGAGLNTTFDGLVSQGNQRTNLVINGGGSLTLSNGGNTYSSRQSTGSTASGYQGPGTWILGQGQSIPALTGLPATFTGMPASSTGGKLLVSNTTGTATGVSPILLEGATTAGGAGGTFGGDGIVSSFVTTFFSDVGETNVTPYATSFAAGPHVTPLNAGSNAGTLLTINGGLHVGDYTNFDFVVGATPSSSNNTDISVTNTTDATLVTTALSLPADGNVEVNFNAPGAVTLGSPYTLISYTGTDSGGGAALANWQATGVPAGDTVTFADTGSAITATFNAVPEPATIGLVAIGSLGLLRRRRNRA
jgi:autotransporter-associated beta strand protein